MTTPVRIVGIAGSLRQGSFNAALLRAAGELLPDGVTLDTFDHLRSIPPYDDDVRVAGFPPEVGALRAQLASADALLFVTPEYNYGVPGVLKNAIDWASRPPEPPMTGKPAAIMSASPSMLGGARAQYQLRQTLVFLDVHPINKPEVMVAKAGERFDAHGKLTDEVSRKLVGQLLAALATWTRRLRGEPQ